MAQKVLVSRTRDLPGGDLVEAEVDQVVLVRSPAAALGEAVSAGLKKTGVEVAVAYDGHCVTSLTSAGDSGRSAMHGMLAHGVLVARAGVGFPAPVHLERFASPARLCVTDEPRLAGAGGIGMLTVVVPTAALGRALAHGTVVMRRPVSVQIMLTGRLRPFVCARDVALELLRRGIGDVVRRVGEQRGAPVVVEFAGPSARALSVGERSVIAAVAPQLGAAAALFVGDERTEVFLRDQRRSKAHRALAADAGAPTEEVVTVDLGAVDPLLLDDHGKVRAARDMAGQPVSQVILGGDGGATLRDLFAVATLLKSKRVSSRVDFLVAVPSRQMLEVLSGAGALTDLIATGARLIEPDARVVRGEMYPPHSAGLALRTFEPEPRIRPSPGGPQASGGAVVGSAETLAYAVATGEVGDPRSFKRPVRITVPRVLPTDDVLVARKPDRGAKKEPEPSDEKAHEPHAVPTWKAAETLDLVTGQSFDSHLSGNGHSSMAVLCGTLDEVRELASRAPAIAGVVRAVLAPYIPASLVTLFSAAGIAAIRLEGAAASKLEGQKTIVLPAPSQWAEREATTVTAGGGGVKLPLTWLALGSERAWATGLASLGGLRGRS